MIEVFLSKDYDKDLLKAYLEYTRKSASRELKYHTNHTKGTDVNIENIISYTNQEVHHFSSYGMYRDDLCVFIDNTRVSEYLNGEPVGVDTIYKYIKEM